jgi:hypothetical protein
MYPDTYTLVDDLDKLEVPIVPISAGWKNYPGDLHDVYNHTYSDPTVDFLEQIASQVDKFSVREYFTEKILRRHGINNTLMTGDCAWYDIDRIGENLETPSQVDKLVFTTTPHSSRYLSQAREMIQMLSDTFPDAERYCSFHGEINSLEEKLRSEAEKNGFETVESSHDTSNLELYDECDLHVGYRVHGHIAFLRKRIPSVLLNEDGRGCGFSYTFGTGGFNALSRGTRGSIDIKNLIHPRRGATIATEPNSAEYVRDFILEELDNGFRRYQHIPQMIDSTYQSSMKPFIDSLP